MFSFLFLCHIMDISFNFPLFYCSFDSCLSTSYCITCYIFFFSTQSFTPFKPLPPSAFGNYSLLTVEQSCNPPCVVNSFFVLLLIFSISSLVRSINPVPYQTVATRHVLIFFLTFLYSWQYNIYVLTKILW